VSTWFLYLFSQTLFSAAKYKFARRTVKRSFVKTAIFYSARMWKMVSGGLQTAPAKGPPQAL